MDFTLPADVEVDEYFRGVATPWWPAAGARGCRPTSTCSAKLSKDGVNAILYPASDIRTHGVARIYGQCHDMNDHRGETAEWIDITDQLH